MTTELPTNSPATPRTAWDRLSVAALWATALVLTGLIGLQAGRAALSPGAPDAASAVDMVSRIGDFTLMTFDGGNEDVVAVLDGRAEKILTYRVHQRNEFQFIQAYDLPALFQSGREIGAGGRRR